MSEYQDMGELLDFWIEELHRREPDSIGDLLHFRRLKSDMEAGEYVFQCQTMRWMCNPTGTLHGGIIATIIDQGMGMVANCMLRGKAIAPSIQLDVGYQRPLRPGEDVLIKVIIVSVTKSLVNMRGEVYQASDPAKVCSTGVGVYFVKAVSENR